MQGKNSQFKMIQSKILYLVNNSLLQSHQSVNLNPKLLKEWGQMQLREGHISNIKS